MERFNKTTQGYRFDKVIFWSAFLIIACIVASQFMIHGFKFKPYFVCDGILNQTCVNPFYNEGYKCTLAFGMKKCNVQHEDWMDEPFLPAGEYGEKPIKTDSFVVAIVGIFLLAFGLNHINWNKGKNFHVNIMDKLDKFGGKFEDDEEH